METLLTKYRGIFATFILLPISVAYNLYLKTKRKISFWLRSAPKKHDQRVDRIREELKSWVENGCKEKLTTGRSGWFTMSELVPAYKKTNRRIPLNLHDIIEINHEKRTVRVEPQVNMGQLSSYLLKRGWTVAVLPELDQLTVGGLINGFGIETSSHKYGLFQYTCVSFEVVTPDGTLLKCDKHQNTELFSMIPWSYGTFGFLVAAELKIVPAKKYVRLEYIPVYSQNELVDRFEKASREITHDFVEALVFNKEEGVLLFGNLADKMGADGRKNAIGRWYKTWFYTHVHKFLTTKKEGVEYIPIRHYYHRHTRSLFWMMGQVIPFGNHPIHRFLFGWAMPPQMSLMKYFETETTRKLREKHSVTQDMLVPIERLKKSLDYFHEHFNLYPLWLCPMAVYEKENGLGMIHPYKKADGSTDDMFVDIGAYGIGSIKGFDGNEALKGCEQFVIENKGYQALYAKTFLSGQDFRKMFDHSYYDQLRDKIPFARQAFPDIYDKLSLRIAPVDYKKINDRK